MGKCFRRWTRIAATGLSFGYFGLAALALRAFVLPVTRRLPGDARRREERAQYAVHRVFRAFVRFMSRLGVLTLSVRNAERLREPGGFVIVANHPTLLDYVMIGSLMPQLDCVVKREIFESFFMRGVATATGYLPNDPGDTLVDACAERVAAGRSLLLFPEGTRSPRGTLGPFRRGAAHTALRAGRPLRPVVIRCEPPSLMRGQKWYDVPERAMQFTLEVGEPIDPTPLAVGAPRGAGARRLTAALRDHFAKELAKGCA